MNKVFKSIISLVLCLCIIASTSVVGLAASVAKVTNLEATSFTDTKVSLKWKKGSSIKGYEVYRQKGSDDWKRLKRISSIDTVTYNDTKLDPGTVYNYRVRAYTTSGLKRVYGEYSDTLKVATKPQNVSSLKATATGASTVSLTWNKSKGAAGYGVFMYNAKTKAYDRLAKVSENSYEVTGLAPSTKYYFKVRAYHELNGTIVTEYAQISITTPIADVTNFRLKACTDTSYSVSWNKSKNVNGYEIYRYNVKTQDWEKFKTTSSTTIYFKGLKADYNALYKIRTYVKLDDGKVAYGVFTEPLAVGTTPRKVTGLEAAADGNNGASLKWNAINGVQGYEIYRWDSSAGAKGEWAYLATSAENSYSDFTLKDKSAYRYKVCAYKGGGDNIFRGETSDDVAVYYEFKEETKDDLPGDLDEVGLIGYWYDDKNKCFYTADDPWQRNFGYNEVYDNAAGLVLMIIDTIRIKFEYKDKDWMIQGWKGQYGMILVGAEFGVYNKEKDRNVEHYDCVKNEDMLWMEMELQKLETVNGKKKWNRVFFRPYEQTWWITGFVFGNELGNLDNLRVQIRITMKDYSMLSGVTAALRKMGQYYETKGLDVYFTFR